MVEIDHLQIPGYPKVTLKIDPAECIGLSGPSGSGKTRLLRAIADMDEHEGEVRVNGVASQSMDAPAWRRQVGLLPAESVWWFDTVGEHFQSYNTYFSKLGFDESVMQWEPAHCSSGEKQRLSLIRMLENTPSLLLLDEPTANLDSENTGLVEKLVFEYLQTEQASAIWVAHSRSQLQRVAQRYFRMKNDGMVQVTE